MIRVTHHMMLGVLLKGHFAVFDPLVLCITPGEDSIGSERGTSKLVQVCADGSALVPRIFEANYVEA